MFPLIRAPYSRALFAGAILTGSLVVTSCSGGGSPSPTPTPTSTPTPDTRPAAITLEAQTDVARSIEVTSTPVTITGIDAAATISITDGEYSINGGDFTAAEGTVLVNDEVAVRLTSSAEFDTAIVANVLVGGVTAEFSVTTIARDVIPDVFTFSEQVNVQLGQWIESNSVILSGFDDSLDLTVSNGEYSLNGAEFSSAPVVVNAGAEVSVRHLSPNTFGESKETEVIVGELASVFSSSTQYTDSAPVWGEALDEAERNSILPDFDSVVAELAYKYVVPADMDGDGDVDFVMISIDGNAIVLYESNGSATPMFSAYTIDVVDAKSIFAEDINGDGHLDVVILSNTNGAIIWYENDGNESPSFTKQILSSDLDRNLSMRLGDMEGDSDVDVLVTSSLDDSISWYVNNGGSEPIFSKKTASSSEGSPVNAFSLGDLDGDGDLDVLSVPRNVDNIIWYESQDMGMTYVRHSLAPISSSYALSISVGDVDGDGDLDVLSASEKDETVAWYENDGGAVPSFTQHDITTDADLIEMVAVADLDNDGDLDVLSSTLYYDTVWYENDGGSSPKFSAHTISYPGGPTSVADVDGDGVQDVIVGTFWYSLPSRYYWVEAGEVLVEAQSATDADGNILTYSLNGAINHAEDASYFSINSSTGELIFSGAPPEASAADQNADSIYFVWISVTDGQSILNRAIVVRVYDNDLDDDNDGVPDTEDAFPFNPAETLDTDGDGVGNNADWDDDGDQVPDEQDPSPLG